MTGLILTVQVAALAVSGMIMAGKEARAHQTSARPVVENDSTATAG